LNTTLSVDISTSLLSVSSTGENDVSNLSTLVTVVALVNNESILGNIGLVDIIGTEEPDELRLGLGNLSGRSGEANLESTSARSLTLKDVVTLPLLSSEVRSVLVNESTNSLVVSLGVNVVSNTRADNNHRSLSVLEGLGEGSRKSRLESSMVGTEMLELEGGVPCLANNTNLKVRSEPLLSDTGVKNSGFMSGVAANNQDSVGLLNTPDLGVEKEVGSNINTVGERLATGRGIKSQVLRAKLVGHVLGNNQRFNLSKSTSNNLEFVALGVLDLVSTANLGESLLPISRLEAALAADQRHCQSLSFETVTGKSGLIVDPLLVHVVVKSGENTHDLKASRVDTDVGTKTVKNIDRFGVLQFPGTGAESIRLGSKSTNRAEVDNVARHLGVQVLLEVGTNLNIVTTAGRSHLRGSGDIVGETNATGAVNTSVHRGLNQGADVLILDGSLAANFVESASIGSVTHRLILKITLTTLITDGAIEGMVGEQEFHNTLTGLVGKRRVGLDDHSRLYRPGTRGDGLRGPLDLHQTHSAVTGNHKLPEALSVICRSCEESEVSYSW
jgi:hypothetical protein